jgi:hypothetical protein
MLIASMIVGCATVQRRPVVRVEPVAPTNSNEVNEANRWLSEINELPALLRHCS